MLTNSSRFLFLYLTCLVYTAVTNGTGIKHQRWGRSGFARIAVRSARNVLSVLSTRERMREDASSSSSRNRPRERTRRIRGESEVVGPVLVVNS